MAYGDDEWMRQQRRQQSFLPGANNGQYLMGSGVGPSSAILNRPQQNYGTPAAGRQRLRGNQLDTYQIPLPEGGFSTIRVAAGSRAPANAQPYQQFTPTTAQTTAIQQQGYAQGYGPTATFNPQTQTQSYAGVETPVEQLGAAQRSQFGVPSATQTFKENPFNLTALVQNPLAALNPLAYNALNSVANIFRENRQNQQSQYTYNRNSSQYQLPPPPRRYSDYY